MTRILCCWELGGGLGHLFRLLPLGLVLKKWGHQVIMATPDANQGKRLLQPHGFQLATTPAWQPPPRAFPLSQNYAQNLLRNGYWHRESLSNNLTAWLALFAKFQPDVVVTEHAPTALLAARMDDLPRAAVGTGFSVPPSVSPMPGLQPWFSLPASYLLGLERDFLDQVNPVLRNLGSPPLEMVADIFAGAEKILCTLPEFDHYDQRSGEPYWGPVTYTPTDLQPSWPPGEGPKLFIYLHPAHRLFYRIIEVLTDLGLPALVFAPHLAADDCRALSSRYLSVTADPVDLQAVARQCRLMISQGGHNAGVLMLLAGASLLICPRQLEQAVWAYRLSSQNLGVMVNYFNPQPDLPGKLDHLLNNPAAEDQVGRLAAKYQHLDPEKILHDIASRCVSLTKKPVNA